MKGEAKPEGPVPPAGPPPSTERIVPEGPQDEDFLPRLVKGEDLPLPPPPPTPIMAEPDARLL